MLDENRQVDRSEILWRRIHSDHYIDGRITSAAFKNYDLSVDIASLQDNTLSTLGHGVGIASFSADVAYENGQDVRRDPIDNNVAHALVIGGKPRSVRLAFCAVSQFTRRDEIDSL